jgi:lysophospholipase L1-like esterase
MRGRYGLLMLLVMGLAGCDSGSGEDGMAHDKGWVGSWSAAPYGPFPAGPLDSLVPPLVGSLTTPGAFIGEQARDQSFRMIVHPTLGGDVLRVRLSNLKGDRPLRFEPVRVAHRALGIAAAIVPSTDTPVLFNGQTHVVIPPGAEAISDAVALPFADGEDLVVSFRLVGDSGPMTWHAVSFDTQFVSAPGSGDRTGSATGLAFPFLTLGWFFLSGIDVLREDSPGSIVMLGDSITDGAFQVPATNTRMPDVFARRLQGLGIPMGVLNQGINSNTVTEVDSEPFRGPPAVQRFERDVLQRAGVRSLLLFEGTNDLTAGADAAAVYAGLRNIMRRAQSAGLCVVLGTIPPRDDILFGWDRASMEVDRQALNEMIRNDPDADAIADFDVVLRAAIAPTRPNATLYFPDLLHPNSLGFIAMANAIPLEALVPPPAGRCARGRP